MCLGSGTAWRYPYPQHVASEGAGGEKRDQDICEVVMVQRGSARRLQCAGRRTRALRLSHVPSEQQ